MLCHQETPHTFVFWDEVSYVAQAGSASHLVHWGQLWQVGPPTPSWHAGDISFLSLVLKNKYVLVEKLFPVKGFKAIDTVEVGRLRRLCVHFYVLWRLSCAIASLSISKANVRFWNPCVTFWLSPDWASHCGNWKMLSPGAVRPAMRTVAYTEVRGPRVLWRHKILNTK